MEVPEPCRKARQARPLSLPQASRPSGLFKHIDPVSVALSAHPLRARPLSRDFEARCAQPGACVGGSGPGSKCRRGERATDLQYPATLAARFRVSHFVACCHAAQASPWGGGRGCVQERSLSQHAAPHHRIRSSRFSFFPPTLLRKDSWKLVTAACIVEEGLQTDSV